MDRSLRPSPLGYTARLHALILTFGLATLAGCSGGGGGAFAGGSPVLLRITMQGVTTPLWEAVNGLPVPISACPPDSPLNGQINFTFGGPVDALSLPGAGVAAGSIAITALLNNQILSAQGSFSVEDEPGLPPGNLRRVVFRPTLPLTPSQPMTAGLFPGLQYAIFLPAAGSGAPPVVVAGQALAQQAATCFVACDPQAPGTVTCLTDNIPGDPYVVSTTPNTGDPVPPPIDPVTVAGNTVSLVISEALDPTSINIANVKLLLQPAGTQVPGTVSFFQTSNDPTLGTSSRIEYIASSTLLSGSTYELQISSLVTDFGGNPLTLAQNDPGARRLMQMIAVPFCAQPPLVEDFSSTANQGTVGVPLIWDGSGQVTTSFPEGVLGNQSAGPVVFTAVGSPHVIDTGTISGTGIGNGVWNATTLTIEPNAVLQIKGAYPVHFRCRGDVNIGANAIILGNAPLPDSGVDGPWKGGANNTSPTPGGTGNPIVFGGEAGPGAGQGGDASQAGDPTRTVQGETGDGPSVQGQPGMIPSDPFYGAGAGGEGSQQAQSVIGAGGGAGGSAYGRGGDGLPLNGVNSAGLCGTPLGAPPVTAALAQDPPPGFVPPVSQVSGGSGGGGGGDRFDLVTATINLDDQGGAGGGGGGGFRITTMGDIDIGAGAHIEMTGSPGNNCESLGSGAGGSGSGGMIWLQCGGQLSIDPNATLEVRGGGCPTGMTGLLNYRCAGAPGLGGMRMV